MRVSSASAASGLAWRGAAWRGGRESQTIDSDFISVTSGGRRTPSDCLTSQSLARQSTGGFLPAVLRCAA